MAQKVLLEYYRAKLNLVHAVHPGMGSKMAIDLFQRPYARKRKEPPIWQKSTPFFFNSNGNRIAGYRWVPHAPAGKKFLILHGFSGSGQSFDRYIKPALAKGYEVHSIDAPGHGKSGGKHLNLLLYSWVIEDLLKQHGPYDRILAHSLSGMSLMLAIDKLGLHHQKGIMLMAPLVTVKSAIRSFQDFLRMRPELRRDFVKGIEDFAGRPITYYHMPELIKHHKAPIFWFHDRQDDTTPFSDLAELEHAAPDHLHLVITENLGHSGIYRENKVYKQVLQILDDAENCRNS